MVKWMGRVAIVGAAVQIGYGLLACVFRYPTITDPQFEVLWALVNVGMIVNIAVWLSIKVASPRLALVGGGLAILGHALRAAISLVTVTRANANVDTPIVISIMLMFVGIALLGVATLRARQMRGLPAWAPLLVLAGGLVAAPFYSLDRVVHFILLGLLWGGTWLYMAVVAYRYVDANVEPRASVASAARASSKVV